MGKAKVVEGDFTGTANINNELKEIQTKLYALVDELKGGTNTKVLKKVFAAIAATDAALALTSQAE